MFAADSENWKKTILKTIWILNYRIKYIVIVDLD